MCHECDILAIRRLISPKFKHWLYQNIFVCASQPAQQQWLDQWNEFGAGLSAWLTNGRHIECSVIIFANLAILQFGQNLCQSGNMPNKLNILPLISGSTFLFYSLALPAAYKFLAYYPQQ